uniref:Uncharacterized protein n=1 Tax=Leersia perrieri TaxID=77586 RepID=A0A0D9X5Z7_9ORYZ
MSEWRREGTAATGPRHRQRRKQVGAAISVSRCHSRSTGPSPTAPSSPTAPRPPPDLQPAAAAPNDTPASSCQL